MKILHKFSDWIRLQLLLLADDQLDTSVVVTLVCLICVAYLAFLNFR